MKEASLFNNKFKIVVASVIGAVSTIECLYSRTTLCCANAKIFLEVSSTVLMEW